MSPLKPGDPVLILLPAEPNTVGRMGMLLVKRDDKWRLTVEEDWWTPEKALMRVSENIWPKLSPSSPRLVIAA